MGEFPFLGNRCLTFSQFSQSKNPRIQEYEQMETRADLYVPEKPGGSSACDHLPRRGLARGPREVDVVASRFAGGERGGVGSIHVS